MGLSISATTERTYEEAKNNEEFVRAIEADDNCWVPTWFASDIEKITFACIYKGWKLKEKSE